MATKDPDKIKVSVVVDVTVSERKWREMCLQQGISLDGQVIPAHVARSVKAGALAQMKAMGFPQEET